MNATGKRRLLKLADFLETADLGRAKFEMAFWTDGLADEDGEPTNKKLGDCGTAACAFGWATTIPSFRRAGLRLDDTFEPVLDGGMPSGSAAEFFDLNRDQVDSLFAPPDKDDLKGKRGRKIVARRIRALVASSEARAA